MATLGNLLRPPNAVGLITAQIAHERVARPLAKVERVEASRQDCRAVGHVAAFAVLQGAGVRD